MSELGFLWLCCPLSRLTRCVHDARWVFVTCLPALDGFSCFLLSKVADRFPLGSGDKYNHLSLFSCPWIWAEIHHGYWKTCCDFTTAIEVSYWNATGSNFSYTLYTWSYIYQSEKLKLLLFLLPRNWGDFCVSVYIPLGHLWKTVLLLMFCTLCYALKNH